MDISNQSYFNSVTGVGDQELQLPVHSQHAAIDAVPFIKDMAVLALENVETILEHWLPDGKYQGQEYVVLNPKRQDNNVRSFSINRNTGRWSDFADSDPKARGWDLVSLIAYLTDVSQVTAAKQIQGFLQEETNNTDRPVRPAQTARPSANKEWTAIVPVPANAPPPPTEHYLTGKASKSYAYLDANGLVLCYQVRFETVDSKVFRPLTYGSYKNQFLRWEWKGLRAPRPLYGLRKLAKHPSAPVLICEGEKAVEAAQTLFPQYVCVTSLNGSQSPEKSDWSPLKGRQTCIWPDNDVAGLGYANKVTELLLQQDPKADVTIMKPLLFTASMNSDGKRVLAPRDSLPSGWDAADAVAEGWTADHMKLLGDGQFEQVPTSQIEEAKKAGGGETVTSGQAPVQSAKEAKEANNPTSAATTVELCEKLIDRLFGGHLVYANETFYGYSRGCWSALDENVDVKKRVFEHFGKHAKLGEVTFLAENLKVMQAARSLSPHRGEHLICLDNGTLNPKSGQLLPHNPEHRLRNKLDIAWDPNAPSPRWLQFLDEIFANDSDKEQRTSFLQEWFGYCLVPDTSQHKFLWMVGSGGNGKSVVLDIMAALVGHENVSHAYIERLDNKNVRAELEGKLLNISSEMGAEATVADGYLKAIVAGDLIEAERKFKDPFSFRPTVRLVAATNELPRLLDITDGFFRRAVILSFNRQFSEAEQDKRLKDRLLQELPGIFKWAVEGLQRVQTRGSFEIPHSSVAAVSVYRRESDQIRLFLDENMKIDRESRGLLSREIYERYLDWAKGNGFHPLNISSLGKRLKSLGIPSHLSGGYTYWQVSWNHDFSRFDNVEVLPRAVSSLASKYSV